MPNKTFKYIYGPVPSWRLGRSLGIDLLLQDDKICNFNCSYCQVGETPYYTNERQVYIRAEDVLDEINALPSDVFIDFITFSGRGEPTLAKNLKEMIESIRAIRKEPMAILTNATLIHDADVASDLGLIDFVCAKLDVASEEQLESINRPSQPVRF